ncbi:hypothetical protein [Pelotalea chapellei]|uniref:Uncharacterized protein n=1 Tax=Pelotalea chapellei TaxID=44671 RepID=A0ABS5UAU1_9BACT|nr:hypothetical protein [Pelotalea chapellei]MBT1072743.1 hypothetical protein [Pelotalea chapellei]
MIADSMTTCKFAGERFFRLYHRHCVSPDDDTLFSLLDAIHSLNDKLQKATSDNFFECHEFIALKALRNLFHHGAELINEVRPISVASLPISTDLMFLCLVPRSLVLQSIERLDKKRRVQDEAIIRSTLKWYGNVVNINPCLFNFAVHAFEKLRAIGFKFEGDEYAEFEHSYQFEEEGGHSHFVTGDISCLAGNVEEVLSVAFADIT